MHTVCEDCEQVLRGGTFTPHDPRVGRRVQRSNWDKPHRCPECHSVMTHHLVRYPRAAHPRLERLSWRLAHWFFLHSLRRCRYCDTLVLPTLGVRYLVYRVRRFFWFTLPDLRGRL